MLNSTLENINLKKKENDLASIAQEHPYYSPGQFWLLSAYRKNNHPDFKKQALITSLFFKSQNWLNWQLSRLENTGEKNDGKAVTVSPANNHKNSPEIAAVPVTQNEDPVTFEPLHTIDYFASQGIKINEENIATDKLGTQLKSFTEWLKSMKKIHSEKLAEGDEQTDKIIQHIAESSNNKIEVVTEAMAEVLLNQGKVEQAIEMYNKLSLNYPPGSAYFAAKINSLKQV